MANVIQTFPRGTGGGHTILDTTGSPVTDRKEMQFKGLSVADNSTDEVTEIEAVGLNQDSLDDIANANISNVMVGSGDCYSTSEQIIGRWYDGKPIYQRTFTLSATTIPAQSWISTNIDSSNIEQIIKGCLYYTTDGVYASDIVVGIHGSGNTVELFNVRGNGGLTFDAITIQYTKKS